MRASAFVWAVLLMAFLGGCASAPLPALEDWSAAEDDACEGHDRCVARVCADDLCGLYHCEDTGVLLARGGIRPPVSAAAPGAGPRRNWGSAQPLPGDRDAIFVIRWYNHPAPAPPPDGRKPSGSGWVRHHLYPQAADLAQFFWRQGKINVHDFTMVIPRAEHVRLHGVGGRGGPWNQAWRDFARKNIDATPKEIQDQLARMIVDFNIMGPIVPYHQLR
ncbi:TIGR02269 family lipoprotein [Corallococcus sp. AB049A]|uniref:TIGR02269 family lipoprotein n=1 Tax=Corallococcus interemptor TaxID=2316720 RepID=A0A3A8QG18_9BACT|nr:MULTISPECIES: TIGR02269 family lipoprotein [Corallococcus]RKH67636.1 TIGR02269 family lipoprotein [Corallococcus interemptor]RKI73673.1 TIGR02269 family lipoprotein [Corallococcus sp. AB049A]